MHKQGEHLCSELVSLCLLVCPKGEARCIQCRMTGVVMSQDEHPPLGILAAVEFTNGTWCEERWEPRHLLDLDSLNPSPSQRAASAGS